MFLASKLAETSRRFSVHVQEIREFLLKEKLPVPSPEAIPELSSRLSTDTRFRADVSSLVRAVMYREREQIGYEDLLGILVAAAAGTEQDVTSDAQEACTREMLRFLLQSRRATVPVEVPVEAPVEAEEAEEAKAAAEDETPVPVETRTPVEVAVETEPATLEAVQAEPVYSVAGRSERVQKAAAVQAAAVQAPAAPRWAVESVNREPKLAGSRLMFVAADTRESGEGMLPPFRTSELFAAQPGLEAPWWRTHAVWIVGVFGVLLGVGVGAGVMMRRGVPAMNLHSSAPAANVASSGREVAGAPAAKNGADSKAAVSRSRAAAAAHRPGGEADAAGVVAEKPAPVEPAKGAAMPDEKGIARQLAVGRDAAGAPRTNEPDGSAAAFANTASVHTPDGAAVPVTVVKQVVTASENDEVEEEPTPTKAATRSIVQPGAAGIMAANVIFSPPPDYPAEATAAHVQGAVTVRAVVDPDGHVIYARVVSGPTLLRDAALEAVQKWRYKPLLYFGKPIAVATTAILDFRVVK